MGFMDQMQDALNRGTASVGRASRGMQINSQLKDLQKQRQNLAAQLGASLYDVVKDNAELKAGRESLIDGMAQIDAQVEQLKAEQAALDQQSADSTRVNCPFCSAPLNLGDAFCSGCGKPIDEVKSALNGVAPAAPAAPAGEAPAQVCASCGAGMGADDMFCMTCGAPVQAPAAEAVDDVADAEDATEDATDEAIDLSADDTVLMDPVQVEEAEISTCPFCSGPVVATDAFCGGCGKSMAEMKAQAASGADAAAVANTCPSCGAEYAEGDAFCMSCGTALK